ncbi:MAG TPA: hypothetical protein VEG63_10135 [Candidatus Acidoferrales bacterium]|nr:hypothetical protein [Candidatus Acidoferrales bacterium]
MPAQRFIGIFLFLLPPAAGLIALWFVPPIAQPESYHLFADQRRLLGIPNFWNVVSNLPFAVAGLAGLMAFRDLGSRLLFAGIFLTTFGSAYYHWAPDTPRLAWDRLPITVAFMALLALLIQVPFGAKAGRWLLLPLVAAGLLSVVWWRMTGDLRVYLLVQFAPMLMIPVALAFFEIPGRNELWIAVVLYALAKVGEFYDTQIFSHMFLSGHTLKHLLAGASTWSIFRWRRGATTAFP